jgi:hypothetical protein
MKVAWHGREYLVVDLYGPTFLDKLDHVLTKNDVKDLVIGLIPARFIDLNS